jgi:hypothetical protein
MGSAVRGQARSACKELWVETCGWVCFVRNPWKVARWAALLRVT